MVSTIRSIVERARSQTNERSAWLTVLAHQFAYSSDPLVGCISVATTAAFNLRLMVSVFCMLRYKLNSSGISVAWVLLYATHVLDSTTFTETRLDWSHWLLLLMLFLGH